jgi:DNA gyrase/topoisomerase IV subunit B
MNASVTAGSRLCRLGWYLPTCFVRKLYISTIKGGSHINYIADQIAKNLITAILKKKKAAAIELHKIKEHMWFFVNALIENPTFGSQTKETMTLLSSNFGSKPTLSEEFMKKGEFRYSVTLMKVRDR